MLKDEKTLLEEYKYELLLNYFNQNRVMYNYKDVISLGFSWTAFKRFSKIFESKFPNTKIILFSGMRSFVIWSENDSEIYSYGGKTKFKKIVEDYMIEWLSFNNKINMLDNETQKKYKRVIRRFRRYGKLPANSQI